MSLATAIAERNHRPTVQCWIDNRRVYGVKGRIVFSMRAKVAICTLTLRTRPSWLAFRQRVEVNLGYNGLTRRRFTGFIEDDGRRVWPYAKEISAAGYMRWAERLTPTTLTYSSQGAQSIITDLLTEAGVPYANIGGDDTTLATVEDIVLAKRQSYISLIEQIDEPWLCRTFDWLPDGTVRRLQMTELPAAGAKWAYTYPGNVLSLDNPLTVREVKNRVEVKGLDDVEAYRRADSPYVDPDHDEIHEVSSDLIETDGVADDVALLQMPTVNRLTRRVVIRVAGNPLLDPGDTISLDAATVGINTENLWLEEIDDQFDDYGYFSQLTLVGGAGDSGYPIYPPRASFSMAVTREAFDAGGGVAVYYTILCDGSASSSPEGKAITYDWSNDVTADVGTDAGYSFKLTEAEFAGGCNVTLVVTDTSAEDDTLVRSVTEVSDEDGTIIRTLYTARETEAEATGDSGENWTTDAAVDAQATPEITGVNHSYYADGAELYYTDNLLATKTLVHTFAATVNWIWLNEIDANRVMVGCEDGKVLTTSDASLLAAATWTEEHDSASAINFVCWSYDNVRWVLTGGQVLANYTVQWVHTSGYTAKRLALSFVAHYSAADDGGGNVEVKRHDGVVLTFAGGVPTAAGGLQHHIRDDILYFADGGSDDFYAKAAGSTVLTKIADIGGGACYHLLRDGTNALVLWAACADGLYKTYDGGYTWYQMRAGKTRMVGYGSAPWAPITPLTVVSNTDAVCYLLGTEPDGWRVVSFDDSRWGAAVVQTVDPGGGTIPDGSSKIAHTDHGHPSTDVELVRHVFAMSAGVVTSATLQVTIEDGGDVWINNVHVAYQAPFGIGGVGAMQTIALSPTIFYPGTDNVIAAKHANEGSGGPSAFWVAYKLVVS